MQTLAVGLGADWFSSRSGLVFALLGPPATDIRRFLVRCGAGGACVGAGGSRQALSLPYARYLEGEVIMREDMFQGDGQGARARGARSFAPAHLRVQRVRGGRW
jgi:hypothetical protein